MVTGQLEEARVAAGGGGGGHVPLAVGVGHVGVTARMQAQHGHRQRHRGDRIGEQVFPRQLVRSAAHQVGRCGVTDPLPRTVGEREHARLGDDPGEHDLRAAARRPSGQLHPPRRPGGKVPAGAVPDRDHPSGIHRQRREQVDPRRDILERPRPPAAGLRAPVLKVPRRVPAPRQVSRQRPPKRQVIPRPPEPPVNHHHGPKRLTVRQPQFPELRRVRPVPVHHWLSHEPQA